MKWPFILAIIPSDAEPAVLGQERFQVLHLMIEGFLQPGDVDLVEPDRCRNHFLPVGPCILVVLRIVVPDVEAYRVDCFLGDFILGCRRKNTPTYHQK